MALPPKKKKNDPPDPNPKKDDPDYKEDVMENKNRKNMPVKSSVVTTNEVHGAMKAFAKKKGAMSKKTAKRVAKRLKGMKAGASK